MFWRCWELWTSKAKLDIITYNLWILKKNADYELK